MGLCTYTHVCLLIVAYLSNSFTKISKVNATVCLPMACQFSTDINFWPCKTVSVQNLFHIFISKGMTNQYFLKTNVNTAHHFLPDRCQKEMIC